LVVARTQTGPGQQISQFRRPELRLGRQRDRRQQCRHCFRHSGRYRQVGGGVQAQDQNADCAAVGPTAVPKPRRPSASSTAATAQTAFAVRGGCVLVSPGRFGLAWFDHEVAHGQPSLADGRMLRLNDTYRQRRQSQGRRHAIIMHRNGFGPQAAEIVGIAAAAMRGVRTDDNLQQPVILIAAIGLEIEHRLWACRRIVRDCYRI
jgi:hypothetical protein